MLASGDFDALIGIAEHELIEVKEIPFILSNYAGKSEFAKDVSAPIALAGSF